VLCTRGRASGLVARNGPAMVPDPALMWTRAFPRHICKSTTHEQTRRSCLSKSHQARPTPARPPCARRQPPLRPMCISPFTPAPHLTQDHPPRRHKEKNETTSRYVEPERPHPNNQRNTASAARTTSTIPSRGEPHPTTPRRRQPDAQPRDPRRKKPVTTGAGTLRARTEEP